jgi:hypothetical protein
VARPCEHSSESVSRALPEHFNTSCIVNADESKSCCVIERLLNHRSDGQKRSEPRIDEIQLDYGNRQRIKILLTPEILIHRNERVESSGSRLSQQMPIL